MSKNIVIRIKKAGNRVSSFSIKDDKGNILATNVTKQSLIDGVSYTVDNSVSTIVLSSMDPRCCSSIWNIPISSMTNVELAAIKYQDENTSSLWRHLTNTQICNTFYGCIAPYIIEYPFSYQYYDEIVQNIKDYTKVYKYLPSTTGVFNYNQKVQTNDDYFNKAIIYNDQQSSGILNLVPKPKNNLSEYLKYPKFNSDSKTITFTKKDNFYQINTFWNVTKDSQIPQFNTSCKSLSIDKEVNQDNMDYTVKSFTKAKIRAKDLRIRFSLDDKSNIHLVTQFTLAPSQISYN